MTRYLFDGLRPAITYCQLNHAVKILVVEVPRELADKGLDLVSLAAVLPAPLRTRRNA